MKLDDNFFLEAESVLREIEQECSIKILDIYESNEILQENKSDGLDVIKQSGDDVVIGWTSGSHTLAPIGIFAYGPGAENFSGKIDQTEIYKIITELASEASCSADQ